MVKKYHLHFKTVGQKVSLARIKIKPNRNEIKPRAKPCQVMAYNSYISGSINMASKAKIMTIRRNPKGFLNKPFNQITIALFSFFMK